MTSVTLLTITSLTPLLMTSLTPLLMTSLTPLLMTSLTPLLMTSLTPLLMTSLTPLLMTSLSYFTPRGKIKPDGCAIFYRQDRLEEDPTRCSTSEANTAFHTVNYCLPGSALLDKENVGQMLFLKTVGTPSTEERSKGIVQERSKGIVQGTDSARNNLGTDKLRGTGQSAPEFLAGLSGDSTGASQRTKLQLPAGRQICVLNTHLLFNPKRGDIKLLQLVCVVLLPG